MNQGRGLEKENPKSLPLLSPEPKVERQVLETPSRMSHTGSPSPPSRDICGFCPPSPQLWQMLTVPSWWNHCLAPRSLRDLMPPTPDFSLLCEGTESQACLACQGMKFLTMVIGHGQVECPVRVSEAKACELGT